jgi:twitching motility protein PilT
VILVGELRDRETMEMVLEAAETGHLVLSTLSTVDAAKTVERMVGAFAASEQSAIRSRLAKTFRYIVAQRQIPRKDGRGRVAAVEILKMGPRTLQYVESDDQPGQNLLQAMKNGASDGMQHFDGEIEKLVRAGAVTIETALAYATEPRALEQALSDRRL